MPTTADAVRLRKNWRMIPDRRTASYYRRTAAGPPPTFGSAANVTNVWHRNSKTSPHSGNPGVYVVHSADIYFPMEGNSAFSTTTPPLPGDQIQDAAATTIPYTGRLWTIETVGQAGSLGAWECGCVSPGIISAASILITIARPDFTPSDSGQRVFSNNTTLSMQNAWAQFTESQAVDVLAKRSIPSQFTVYLPTFVAGIKAQDIVNIAGFSAWCSIKANRYPTDLSTLQEIDVELIP